jgi:hypothetical protein
VFTESGLPPGTAWSLSVNGTVSTSNTATIAVNLPNGTYSYVIGSVNGFATVGGSGSATLLGTGVSITVSFVPYTYNVTVIEEGLVSGISWGLTVGSTTMTSSVAFQTFPLANGSYNFTIGPVPGYSSTPTSGSWTISGNPTTVYIDFVSAASGQTGPGSKSAPAPASDFLPYEVAIGILVVVAVIGWLLALRHRRPENPSEATPPPPPTTPPPGIG